MTLLAALVAVGPAAASYAAPPVASKVLVLSGLGGTYADITLSRGASVVPMHLADARYEDGSPRFSDGWGWVGCGGVRGFYLRPLSGDPLAGVGAVDFAALRYQPTDLPLPGGPIPRTPIPLGRTHLAQDRNGGQSVPDGTAVDLRPGRYRAFLLGEGRCQVRVPLGEAGRTLRVATNRPAALHARVSTSPASDSPASGVPTVRVLAVKTPVTMRSNTFAFALVHRVAYQISGSVLGYAACVETSALETCSKQTPVTPLPTKYGDYYHTTFAEPPPSTAIPAPVAAYVTQVGTWYAPGWVPSGVAYAKVVAFADQTTSLQAVTFALDL